MGTQHLVLLTDKVASSFCWVGSCIVLPTILSGQVCCPITSGLAAHERAARYCDNFVQHGGSHSCNIYEKMNIFQNGSAQSYGMPDRRLLAQLSDVHPTCAAAAVLAFHYPSRRRMYRSASLPIAPGPSLSEDGTVSHNTPSPALYGNGHIPPGSAVPRLV